jgi:hypothetical protein
MADTVISPNMSLPVPIVSQDIGPQWATDLNACMSIIDQHNHGSGSGVQLTPSALNINTDLPFNINNATLLRSIRFSPQSSPLALASDIGCLYVAGVDLYFNDVSGNQVRITQSGSVTGSSGTITGLPSGTASASYSAATFTFQSATNTPANMAVGPLIIGRNAALSKTVTLTPNAAQAANFGLIFPSALPSATQSIVVDSSGNMSFGSTSTVTGNIPLGGIIATFPNLTGAYSTAATTTADSAGFVLCQGQTIADATSPMNGQVVPNINNSIFIRGNTTAGTSGGASTASHNHDIQHVHQALYVFTDNNMFGLASVDNSRTSINSGDTSITNYDSVYAAGVAIRAYRRLSASLGTAQDFFTSGVINAPAGSGTTAVSGTTAPSIIPPYISAVYLMRIK